MLHYKTVEPGTLGLLKSLMEIPELQQFRLVGGTALSLILGHRSSIDLDLFTSTEFDKESVIDILQAKFSDFIVTQQKSKRLLFVKINNIKTDFVYTFEPFYSEIQIIDNIRIASLPEIAAMKLNAIAGRGAKKDFWDIHRLLKIFSMQQLIDFYQSRYPHNDLMMIIKSFNYFEDAELHADPVSFENINWTTIKKDLTRTLKNYLKTKK